MLRILSAPVLLAVLALGADTAAQAPPAGPSPAADRCAALPALRLPDVHVTEARYAPADKAAGGPVHVAHCRATGVIGTEIGFSVWLPDDWNGRFLMNGGGGYVGSIPGPGPAVDRGFAVTSTDTGHRADGIDARWALQNLERQLNFGYLAVHRTAETAKFIVGQYYGRDSQHAYFVGCSTGGRQGLMEAQRFPGDFDGVVSGAGLRLDSRAVGKRQECAGRVFGPGVAREADRHHRQSEGHSDACLAVVRAKDGVADGVIDDPTAARST
jgi:feruloyl esterase